MSEKADSALMAIPTPGEGARQEWFEITCDYKAEGGSYETWDFWSRQGTGYDEAGNKATWQSISTEGGRHGGGLYIKAKQHGWTWQPEIWRTKVKAQRMQQTATADKTADKNKPSASRAQEIRTYTDEAAKNRTQAELYLNSRGIKAYTCRRFNLGFNPQKNTLVIPYPGEAYFVERLTVQPIDAKGTTKYLFPKGVTKPLFNSPALKSGNDAVFVTEGQIDAISLAQAGAAAIATGGSGGNDALLRAIAEAGEEMTAKIFLIVPDNDEDGEEHAKKILDALTEAGQIAELYRLPSQYHDVNNFLVHVPEEEVTTWMQDADEITARTIIAKDAEYNAQAGAARLAEYEDAWENGRDEAQSTGLPSLDAILDGGLYPGLYTIGAISSLGKTTLVLQIADNIAAAGRDVMFFALEQSAAELTAKTLSRLTALVSLEQGEEYTGALTNRAITTKAKREVWQRTKGQSRTFDEARRRYLETIGKHQFFFEGIGDISAESIRAALQLHMRHRDGKPVIVIDYAQILAPYSEKMTDKQNMDKNIVELKRIARDYNLPVMAISSFNRENYATRVDLTAFKESGAIEYTSDVVIGLQPYGVTVAFDDKTKAKNKQKMNETKDETLRDIEAIVLKNRNGGTGAMRLEYRTLFNLFTDKGRISRKKATAEAGSAL